MADKICGACKKYLVRWESSRPNETCPSAEYRDRVLNVASKSPIDSACDLFQPKFNSKIEELEMCEALKLLNEHSYKCPSDTKEVLFFRNGVYESAESLIHSILESSYGDVLKRHFVDEAYAHLQRANYVDRSEINQYKNKIPLQNGLFNLNTRELEAFDSEQIYTFKLDVFYDPEAKCPNWMEFVKQIVAEEDTSASSGDYGLLSSSCYAFS